jgi:hypothetical protein
MEKKDKKEKKLGSVSQIKEEDSRPFLDRVWDYKPYILVGFIVLAMVLIYFLIFRNLGRNPDTQVTAPDTPPAATAGLCTLEVTTDPTGVLVQVGGKIKRAPAVLEGLPEGEHIVILSLPGYKTREMTVRVKSGEKNRLDIKLEQ